jgi:hypothetical protein
VNEVDVRGLRFGTIIACTSHGVRFIYVEIYETRTDNIQTENYSATYNRLKNVESQQFRRSTIIPKGLPNARDKEIQQYTT